MTAASSKLNMDKFAKVHRLAREGATEGERAAARARAESMAQRAFEEMCLAMEPRALRRGGYSPAQPVVLSMLEAEADLADREIARRCGVSPLDREYWRRHSRVVSTAAAFPRIAPRVPAWNIACDGSGLSGGRCVSLMRLEMQKFSHFATAGRSEF